MKHKIRSCFAWMLAVSTLVTSVPAGVFASEPAMTVKEESSTSGAEENLIDFLETEAAESESVQQEAAETEKETIETDTEKELPESESAETAVTETEEEEQETVQETVLETETDMPEELEEAPENEETLKEPDDSTESMETQENAESTEFSVLGNGSVYIYADGQKVTELYGNKASERLEDLDGKNLTYTMLPDKDNFAYSVSRNEETVAEECWKDCGADAVFSGRLLRSGGSYVFCFMTEEELSAMPVPLGDGSLFPGGRNDHLLGFGVTPGSNIDNPKTGEYYTARAVFYPAIGDYNVHNYFNLRAGLRLSG